MQQQLAALADPTRRAIFERLVQQPLSVGALAETFPISRPAVSQHLRVLKDAQLVLHDRMGTQNIYRVNVEGVERLRDWLDAMWHRALTDFKQAAEATWQPPRKGKKR
jgi:DNA-binding transcriptional ArsR family regulator